MKTLILSRHDVASVLDMGEVIDAVEHGYRAFENRRVVQPDIMSIEIPEENGEIDFKAAYAQDTGFITMKSASGFWGNQQRFSLPNSFSTLQIFDGKSGGLLCIMDASLITGFRTGAAGAISSNYLARTNAACVGLIGAGMQSRTQLRALCTVRAIRQVFVWSVVSDETRQFKAEMEAELSIPIHICKSVRLAVERADIIITVTPSKTPLVQAAWVRPGTHIVAVGADMPGKQELDSALFKAAKVVNDSIAQCIYRGETQNPFRDGIILRDDIYAEIGEIIVGKKLGRTNDREITIFDTTGMAVQDNFTADRIYRLAKEKNLGTYLELI